MLRANSRLRSALGVRGVRFLERATGAFERLLPHAEVRGWTEGAPGSTAATWGSPSRRHINVCINLKVASIERVVRAEVRRKTAPAGVGQIPRTLDNREFDICGRIAKRAAEVIADDYIRNSSETLTALEGRFDEDVVAAHLQTHHGLGLDLGEIFEALRTLAGQTYENKPLSFGCILDPSDEADPTLKFPADFFRLKKYKALTDGFRSGYILSSSGGLSRFIDLHHADPQLTGSDHHIFPEWAEDVARISKNKRCGICLTRAGDILVFDEGTLRFAYRFGRWRYLNHRHIIDLLKNLARVPHVAPTLVGKVAKRIYRTALDVSFRRSGGLLVVLRSHQHLRQLVRAGDAIGDGSRAPIDAALDDALPGVLVQSIPRRILTELAGLDGAVIVANSGALLAYGAIVQPRRRGRIRGAEGSRTKAAIGASSYGLAVKISADGDISVFKAGKLVLSV